MSHRVEPSDWAEKKKLALQRAKDLKYNRANQIDEELTLKPKINARPSYLGSMEKQKVNIVKTQLASNDLFERPLPATIARTKTLLAPSPGSDSLGKMMKSVGGGGGVDKAPTRRSIERADYAYEPAPIVPLGISSRGVERVNAEELFLRSLRSGHGGSELDSSKPAASAAEVRPRRPSQPSSSLTAAAAAAASAASRERLTTPTKPPAQRSSPTKSTTPSKLSPDAKPAAFASPRTQGVVRSRLSLLKQKIRRSEGALTQGLERSKTAGDGTPSPGRDLRGSSSSSLSQGHVPRSAPGLARTLAQQPPPQPQPQQQQQQPSEYPISDDALGEGEAPQHKCPSCGRLFNAAPFTRHIKICAKVFVEKKPVFDSKKMRIGDNPELVALERKKAMEGRSPSRNSKARPGAAAAAAAAASAAAVAAVAASSAAASAAAASEADKKRKIWKEQSEQFRQAMKATRDIAKAISNGDPLPAMVPSAPDPSFIPCPHCGRRFSQKAGERHIPQCQNIRAKPKVLNRGSGLGGGVQGSHGVGSVGERPVHSVLSKPPSVATAAAGRAGAGRRAKR